MSHPLIVNLSSGETVTFDLSTERDLAGWRSLQRTRMTDIRGVSLKNGNTLHALPVPRDGFKRVVVDAERVTHRKNPDREIGTRVTVFVDEISVSVLVYDSDRPRMARTQVEHTGSPVFLPHLNGEQSCTSSRAR